MAISADKVIVELEAKLDRYNANVTGAVRHFDRSMATIQASRRRTEDAFRRNADQIASSFRALAGSIAAAFSVQQIVGLTDSYTRFQNSLRVAGVEGANLVNVQGALFDAAQRNGVGIETLSTLYGRVAQSSRELGASQSELIQFTEGVAAAVRVQGGTVAQAQGALMQLSQALGGATVRAEEFNSINEGARPILQAVASNIDRFGGSVSRLRAEIIEGDVSSQEFFRAFLKGTEALEAQAANSTLTTAQAFTTLRNALVVYFGEADKANGVSVALGAAIRKLADNLDTLIPALVVLGTVLLGRVVGGFIATRVAALSTTVALNGVAASATMAGRALLAAFGGPVGLAVTSLVLGLGYLAAAGDASERSIDRLAAAAGMGGSRFRELYDEARRAREAQEALARSQSAGVANTENLTGATERLTAALRQMGLTAQWASLQAARATLSEARTRLMNAESNAQRAASIPGRGGSMASTAMNAELRAAQAFAHDAADAARAAVSEMEDGLAAGTVRAAPAAASTKKGRGRSGPSAAEITQRYLRDLDRLQTEHVQAQLQVTADAEGRAALMHDLASREYAARLRDIEATEDYSEARKEALRRELRRLYGYEPDGTMNTGSPLVQAINRQEAEQIARELRDVRMEALDAEVAALGQQDQLARTQANRREIQNRLLDAEIQRLEIELNSLQAWQTHERILAQARLDSARSLRAGNQEVIRRETAGPAEAYLDRVRAAGDSINESTEGVAISGFERLNDELAESIAGFLKLGGVAGSVLNEILTGILRIAIQQQIIRPLAEAFFGGGGFGSLFGGKSSGGFDFLGAAAELAPGAFATGGSFTIGGRGGIDRNLLSVNGRPAARVSRGETVAVIPQGKSMSFAGGHAMGGRFGGSSPIIVNIDARDAVLTHAVRAWVREGVEEASARGAAGGMQLVNTRNQRRARQTL